jgi:hypothetical protein
MKVTLCILVIVLTNHFAAAQSLDSMMLKDAEVPQGYKKSTELICATPHACSLYDQVDLYESLLGKVTTKTFQSYNKKGDKGSILYFEFDKPFTAQGFLNGLLWGNETKPSRAEPDEYFAKGKMLIIWSFNLKSEIKQISKAKIQQLMQ